MAKFPTDEWLVALEKKLNSDQSYARIAHKWEWDMKVVIEPGGQLKEPVVYYIDLWHGKCRGSQVIKAGEEPKTAAFTLKAPYENIARVFHGKLDPLQAMITRKIAVQGNMAIMLRNVPTVMDFVRCCREVTDSYI